MDLTEEIKEKVLKDHVYHNCKNDEPKVLNQQINNYHILLNIVNQMPYEEKLTVLLDRQSRLLLDFENQLDDKFSYRIERLEYDQFKGGYFLGLDDLYSLINDVTKCGDERDLNQFNILFDKVVKRFKMFRGKDWESYLEDSGALELVSLLRSYYLNTYEIYLIRNMHQDKMRHTINRFKLREHLEIYYRFLAVFDLGPNIVDFTDNEVLGHQLVDDNDRYLSETYLAVYVEQKKQLKCNERNKIKRKVVNIVRENTVHNLQLLNRTVMELLKLDDSFRDEIIKSKSLTDCSPEN